MRFPNESSKLHFWKYRDCAWFSNELHFSQMRMHANYLIKHSNNYWSHFSFCAYISQRAPAFLFIPFAQFLVSTKLNSIRAKMSLTQINKQSILICSLVLLVSLISNVENVGRATHFLKFQRISFNSTWIRSFRLIFRNFNIHWKLCTMCAKRWPKFRRIWFNKSVAEIMLKIQMWK